MKLSRISLAISLIFLFLLAGVLAGGLMNMDLSSLRELSVGSTIPSVIGFSLKTSFLATVISFLIGVPAGFYLARSKGRTVKLLDVLFDIPIIVPPLIIGVLLLTFFNSPLIRDIYPFVFSTAGAVIAQFFIAAPFTIKSAKTAFSMVPPIYERIAMTLGASPLTSFFDTTFKIALPGIGSGLILTWLRCMGEFGATLMVGGGITGKTENIPVAIYMLMNSGEFKAGITVSLLTVLLVVFCIMLINTLLLRLFK